MNKNILVFPLLFLISKIACGDEPNSKYGIGMGSLNNGLGISYRIDNISYYNYYSVGCYSLGYGEGVGLISNCGIGLSLVSNSYYNSHHAIGLKIGLSYYKRRFDSNFAYQFGANYIYYFSGIKKNGWNMEIGPIFQYIDNRIKLTAIIGFGYQF